MCYKKKIRLEEKNSQVFFFFFENVYMYIKDTITKN